MNLVRWSTVTIFTLVIDFPVVRKEQYIKDMLKFQCLNYDHEDQYYLSKTRLFLQSWYILPSGYRDAGAELSNGLVAH